MQVDTTVRMTVSEAIQHPWVLVGYDPVVANREGLPNEVVCSTGFELHERNCCSQSIIGSETNKACGTPGVTNMSDALSAILTCKPSFAGPSREFSYDSNRTATHAATCS